MPNRRTSLRDVRLTPAQAPVVAAKHTTEALALGSKVRDMATIPWFTSAKLEAFRTFVPGQK